jgi:hypothetical protein
MQTHQIAQVLLTNPATKHNFTGCFPCDAIPYPTKFPMSLVSNTQNSRNAGRHWIAIFAQNPRQIEFFDPLGDEPNACIQKFLNNFQNIKYNRISVQQSWSNACGIFALLYLIHRSRGLAPEKVVSSLQQLPPLLVESLL